MKEKKLKTNYSLVTNNDSDDKKLQNSQNQSANGANNSYIPLSKREKEILQLIADGNPNKTIAEMLNISEHTVRNHITNIFQKLKSSDRTEAAVKALRQGIIN